VKFEVYNDHFQNYKRYQIPKAQLVIADIPYNLGKNAYASSNAWYIDGDNKNGESEKANTEFFDTDKDFRIAEFMHFCNRMLIKEPKEKGKAPAMIVFCSFQQMPTVIEYGKKHGFENSYPLFFIKKSSGQALKANMKILGATEHAVVLYRDKLPKFNNGRIIGKDGKPIRGTGKMVFNWFKWERDNAKEYPKIHPSQKPVSLLKQLIEIFTDEGDIVIDPCAGSATTLRAAAELNRSSFGFINKRDFYNKAQEQMLNKLSDNEEIDGQCTMF